MIVWITGISGAGKTTLAQELVKRFKEDIPELCMVDGDEIRELFGHDLGFEESGRVNQINRIQRLSKMLDTQGLVVIVAALYAHPDLLQWNRDNYSEYYEIYLDASIELVTSRDSKGLYAKARAGQMDNVVGIDIPWNAPANPTLRIDVSSPQKMDDMINSVVSVIPRFNNMAS